MEMENLYALVVSVLLLAVGFVLLVKGADRFVDGASAIARRFGIPQLVIGLTIVAMGTSAPEAAVSITAAVKGNADITIGNIVGSNILNILIILGLSSVVAPLAVSVHTLFRDIPFMIGVTLLLFFQGMGGSVGFLEGVVLMLLFLAYTGWLLWMSKRENMQGHSGAGPKREMEAAQAETSSSSSNTAGTGQLLPLSLVSTLAGLGMIILGSHIAVDAATDLARLFGMSERFIGLTIVALGTSLPELFTSVSAAGKGNADIAIGNIVGSNIFNILFVVGVSALITPVPFSAEFYADMWTAAAAGVLLFTCSVRGRKLGRPGGIVMLSGYILYFIFLCL